MGLGDLEGGTEGPRADFLWKTGVCREGRATDAGVDLGLGLALGARVE